MHPRNSLGLAGLLLGVATFVAPASTQAASALGPYLGGAIGQAAISSDSWYRGLNASTTAYISGSFRENHDAWAVRLGYRPLSVLAIEAEYFDAGHAQAAFSEGTSSPTQADVQMKGAGVYALVYLPVPVLDVYGKVGSARVQSTNRATVICGVATCAVNTNQIVVTTQSTDTALAYGAGVGAKFGPLALRAEYLRFSAFDAHPTLATLGASWQF